MANKKAENSASVLISLCKNAKSISYPSLHPLTAKASLSQKAIKITRRG